MSDAELDALIANKSRTAHANLIRKFARELKACRAEHKRLNSIIERQAELLSLSPTGEFD